MSLGLRDAEAVGNAMALDEVASVFLSLARGWNIASSPFVCSSGSVGVEGRLFFGVDSDESFLRRRCMVGYNVSILFSVCRLAVIVKNLLAQVLTHRPESYRFPEAKNKKYSRTS